MLANRTGVYLKSLLRTMLSDAFLLGGIVAVVYGVHFYSTPAAWIAGGCGAIVLGLSSAEPEKKP